MNQYVALLRGINVGGHHKVPMAELKAKLPEIGFKHIITLLNSGNIIFQAPAENTDALEIQMSAYLRNLYGFEIPVRIRSAKNILEIVAENPFGSFELTKENRLYVSFLGQESAETISLPSHLEGEACRILALKERTVFSIVDISRIKTPKAMEKLEQRFGKDITTRNWNTMLKIAEKLHQ